MSTWPASLELWSKIEKIGSAVTQAECGELYRQAHKSTGPIVEIGSYHGRSTACLAVGSMAARRPWVCHRAGVEPREEPWQPVWAVDPADPWDDWWGSKHGAHDRETFLRAMVALGLTKVVRPVALRSIDAAQAFRVRAEPLGLVFIDGDHAEGPTMADWGAWANQVAPGGAVCLHDTTLKKEGKHLGPGLLLQALFGPTLVRDHKLPLDSKVDPDTIGPGVVDPYECWRLEKRVDSLAVVRRIRVPASVSPGPDAEQVWISPSKPEVPGA